MKLEDYFSGLPLNKVSEIHISHPAKNRDAHLVPTEYEYKLLEYLFRKGVAPKYVTVEFFRDDDKLLEAINRVKEIIKNYFPE